MPVETFQFVGDEMTPAWVHEARKALEKAAEVQFWALRRLKDREHIGPYSSKALADEIERVAKAAQNAMWRLGAA